VVPHINHGADVYLAVIGVLMETQTVLGIRQLHHSVLLCTKRTTADTTRILVGRRITVAEPWMRSRCGGPVAYDSVENCESTQGRLLSSQTRAAISVTEGHGQGSRRQQTYLGDPVMLLAWQLARFQLTRRIARSICDI